MFCPTTTTTTGNKQDAALGRCQLMMILLVLAVVVVALKITVFLEEDHHQQHDHSKTFKTTILSNNNTQQEGHSSSFRKASSLVLPSNNTPIFLETSDNNNDDWKWKSFSGGWSQAQIQAQHALQQMKADKVMDTSVSYRDMVLKKGFPFRWEPCTIRNFFWHKQQQQPTPPTRTTVQVVVLGGSASARPGNNCTCNTTTSTQDLLAGRYSNILQRQLNDVYSFGNNSNHHQCIRSSIHKNDQKNKKPANHSLLQFEIVNMAQGAMDSPTNAILLDQLVNPHTADILVHEFLINDFIKDTSDVERVKRLRFWLTRVKALYARAERSLPPILFVCLWPQGLSSLKPDRLERHGLNAHPMKLFGRVLREFQQHEEKWEFHVINVGAAVKMEWFKYKWHDLIDDGHHPSCLGATLIANMIQHVIHQDISMCKNDDGETNLPSSAKSSNSYNTNTDVVVSQKEKPLLQRPVADAPLSYHSWTHQEFFGDVHDKQCEPLWRDLFREDAMTGSLSLWEPQIANRSSHLHVGNREELFHQKPRVFYGKRAPNRQDRKYAWKLPRCTSSKGESFVVQLQEPHLKWLGIGKSNNSRPITININGVSVHDNDPDQEKGWGLYRIKKWIRMADYFDDNDALPLPSTRAAASNDYYNISLCSSGPKPAAMSFLVGVMIPPASPSLR